MRWRSASEGRSEGNDRGEGNGAVWGLLDGDGGKEETTGSQSHKGKGCHAHFRCFLAVLPRSIFFFSSSFICFFLLQKWWQGKGIKVWAFYFFKKTIIKFLFKIMISDEFSWKNKKINVVFKYIKKYDKFNYFLSESSNTNSFT